MTFRHPKGTTDQEESVKDENNNDVLEDIQAKLSSLRLAMDNVGEAVSTFIKQQRKGQLISKCLFGVFKSPKRILRISAQTSKKRRNQKNKGILLLPLIG